jgi:hypothetical protein
MNKIQLLPLREAQTIAFKEEMQEAFQHGFQSYYKDDNQWQVLPDKGCSDLRREWRINNYYVLKLGSLEYFPYICGINIAITNEVERFFCF